MLEKVSEAIADARAAGRDVPVVIEELFLLIASGIDTSAKPEPEPDAHKSEEQKPEAGQ